MFMGCEFGQEREWDHDRGLDWQLLDNPRHRGIQSLIRDLNHLYRSVPALHELDCDGSGFEWLVVDDADHSVFAWQRKGADANARCIVIVNFTPETHYDYRVPAPFSGAWREVLNTDSSFYGGSNVGNEGTVNAARSDTGAELRLVIPPLAAIFLVPEL